MGSRGCIENCILIERVLETPGAYVLEHKISKYDSKLFEILTVKGLEYVLTTFGD